MKKNGFTLIEVLVVIVLVAAISVTIGVNMSGMQERQTEKEIKNYRETIENAGCVYAEMKNVTTDSEVTVGTLINEGLIKKDLKKPNTKDSVEIDNNKIVKIKWENNEKICTLETN